MSKLKTFKALKLSKKMLSLLLLAVMVIPTVMYSTSVNAKDVKALEVPEAAEGEKLIDCFPDENFAMYVYTKVLEQSNWDKSKSTYALTSDDVIKIKTETTSIDVLGKSIKSLAGIENFTALNTLICCYDPITDLDISYNKNLTYLDVTGTGITNLDLSNNKKLMVLAISNTGITNLDLSNNKELTNLYAMGTGITNLDLSNNILLSRLDLSRTGIKNIDLSNNLELDYLDVSFTGITQLNLSNNKKLRKVGTINCSALSESDLKLPGEAKHITNGLISLPSLPSSLTSIDLDNF